MKKILVLLALSLTAFSCKVDNGFQTSPHILSFSVAGADTTVKVASTINFKAKVDTATVSEQTLTWSVDDKVVSNATSAAIDFKKAGKFVVTFVAKNTLGSDSKSVTVIVKEFLGGFYIVNEGSYGKTMGSINHFDPQTQKLSVDVYKTFNNGLTFGNTTCFGTEFNGSFYFVSKQGNRLVKANKNSLLHEATLTGGSDARAFAGIDANKGVVTTSEGAFLVTLDKLALGAKLEKSEGQCGAIYVAEGHIFVVTSKVGINVYNASDNKLVKEYGKGSVGFTKDKDGNLWAGDKGELYKINPKTLEMTIVTLPQGVLIYNAWGAWNAGSFCASPTENAIFFTKSGAWGGGKEIYKYVIGDQNSLADTFIKSSVADDNFYGAGININPITGDIVATFVKDGWNDYDDNRLVIFDSKTGAEKSRYNYKGFYFPVGILFNN